MDFAGSTGKVDFDKSLYGKNEIEVLTQFFMQILKIKSVFTIDEVNF